MSPQLVILTLAVPIPVAPEGELPSALTFIQTGPR